MCDIMCILLLLFLLVLVVLVLITVVTELYLFSWNNRKNDRETLLLAYGGGSFESKGKLCYNDISVFKPFLCLIFSKWISAHSGSLFASDKRLF